MESRLQRFVAEELWLLVSIVTLALISLAGVAGFELFSGAIAIVGWFLLTPILLFWGDEIAAALGSERETPAPTRERDALDELKHRYASGELGEDEFEHRLSRLLEADDAFERGRDRPNDSSERKSRAVDIGRSTGQDASVDFAGTDGNDAKERGVDR
ncbi:SHOCT domain-containing protein [Natrialba asiatica]|uniref:SHOCT domain-containing protein n=1 Tax=Natrialba asiatica (strain ATCC 700177 / DSM 12278 / JCM 9576 / FERM P-10747 / NBRC 102637 / 172P1) TaxID=29540 RepID=M0ATD4_NATA1|nr:SHOCT domain-containing protein [Natrialba asiatica]ELZ00634.1 hypothetical protein C481_13359 [Natrialba asiatica DSM 12278]